MKWKSQLLLITLLLSEPMAFAGEPGDTASARHITLHEAVQLALQHNHNVYLPSEGLLHLSRWKRPTEISPISHHVLILADEGSGRPNSHVPSAESDD